MKLKRLGPGDYVSECGRVRIQRRQQDGRDKWAVIIDSLYHGALLCLDDAKRSAQKELDRRDGKCM